MIIYLILHIDKTYIASEGFVLDRDGNNSWPPVLLSDFNESIEYYEFAHEKIEWFRTNCPNAIISVHKPYDTKRSVFVLSVELMDETEAMIYRLRWAEEVV